VWNCFGRILSAIIQQGAFVEMDKEKNAMYWGAGGGFPPNIFDVVNPSIQALPRRHIKSTSMLGE